MLKMMSLELVKVEYIDKFKAEPRVPGPSSAGPDT